MKNKKLTTKQKLIILSLLLLNSILPILIGIVIGKCIWSDQINILETIFINIFAIINYIVVSISIMIQVSEFYKQNNYENYKR